MLELVGPVLRPESLYLLVLVASFLICSADLMRPIFGRIRLGPLVLKGLGGVRVARVMLFSLPARP